MGMPDTAVAQGTITQSIGDDDTITQSIGSDQEPDAGGPIVGFPPSLDCTSRGFFANLSLCDLSNADLRYADLTGAILGGILWNHTIYPDGTNANTHFNTCVGHLTPR